MTLATLNGGVQNGLTIRVPDEARWLAVQDGKVYMTIDDNYRPGDYVVNPTCLGLLDDLLVTEDDEPARPQPGEPGA